MFGASSEKGPPVTNSIQSQAGVGISRKCSEKPRLSCKSGLCMLTEGKAASDSPDQAAGHLHHGAQVLSYPVSPF